VALLVIGGSPVQQSQTRRGAARADRHHADLGQRPTPRAPHLGARFERPQRGRAAAGTRPARAATTRTSPPGTVGSPRGDTAGIGSLSARSEPAGAACRARRGSTSCARPGAS
jgi:hypothetical protein